LSGQFMVESAHAQSVTGLVARRGGTEVGFVTSCESGVTQKTSPKLSRASLTGQG